MTEVSEPLKDKVVVFLGRRADFDNWCRAALGVSADRAEANRDAFGIHAPTSFTKLRGKRAREVLVIDRQDPKVGPFINYTVLRTYLRAMKGQP